MSTDRPIHRTKAEHLQCLAQKAAYLRQLIASREEANKPAHYEKQQAHAIESVLDELTQLREFYDANRQRRLA